MFKECHRQMKGWTSQAMKPSTKCTLNIFSVKNEKGEKTGKALGRHVINLYSTGISQWLKIKDVKKLQQGIENDPIIKNQMAGLGCLFVCTFGNYLAPVLIAVHTANNLDFGDEQGHEMRTMKMIKELPFPCLRHHPAQAGLNKMIDCLIKNVIRDHLKTQEMCDEAVDIEPLSLAYIPDHFKTQEMCNKTVRNETYVLRCVPNHFKTQEMCNGVAHNSPWELRFIPDHFKTEEMCNEAVEVCPWTLEDVPDHFKAQEMCDKALRDYLFPLQYVPD